MQTTLRNATSDDSERIADIYLASRKRYLSYAPLAHTDEAVRSWIRDQLIPTGNVIVGLAESLPQGFLATSKDGSHGWIDHINPASFIFEKMNETSWASAILAKPSCAVEDNKPLYAERVKFQSHERL